MKNRVLQTYPLKMYLAPKIRTDLLGMQAGGLALKAPLSPITHSKHRGNEGGC
jgi:hypothetical protein